MKLKKWYQIRGPRFIWQRGTRLITRYGLRPQKAMRRILSFVEEMARLGCAPTFPTPGIVVQRYPAFIRSLQEAGVELAVHGFHHINLRDLPAHFAVKELLRAVRAFERVGIQARGFRCPYLGCSPELLDAVPAGMFRYSSNQPVRWDGLLGLDPVSPNRLFATLDRFYTGLSSSKTVCLPRIAGELVEIPVCVPDDLQLIDGLGLAGDPLAAVWEQILAQTHQHGELFTLLFHTELASLCEYPLGELLCRARGYQPGVWIARLREIADWWREKADFGVDMLSVPAGLRVKFLCTPRATILARGVETANGMPSWDGGYARVQTGVLEVAARPRPWIGLAADVPAADEVFLRNQGYLVERGESGRDCGISLDRAALDRLGSQVDLVNFIEQSAAPMLRYWPWPDGAKSALSITGDLDALNLYDYASRIFTN